MAEIKDPATAAQREESLSSHEHDEKHDALHGTVHAENLDELYDPDAGKTPEERAAIVRPPLCCVE